MISVSRAVRNVEYTRLLRSDRDGYTLYTWCLLAAFLEQDVVDEQEPFRLFSVFIEHVEKSFAFAVLIFAFAEDLAVGVVGGVPAMEYAIPVVFLDQQLAGLVVLFPAAVLDIVLVISFRNKDRLFIELLPLAIPGSFGILPLKKSLKHLFPHDYLTHILHNATPQMSLSANDKMGLYHNSNTILFPGADVREPPKPGLQTVRIV